jgi:hypothetical protein
VGKTEDDEIDALFQLSPPEFVAARNALAARLKKDGRNDVAGRVKALPKPSISAWTVNQLYWKHRDAFEKLLATGERFRQAQASRIAGKGGDLHRLLNERREQLSAMTRVAADILQRASGASPPGVMRRITASLEALSAYGTLEGAPRAGRLVEMSTRLDSMRWRRWSPEWATGHAGKRPARSSRFRRQRKSAAKRKSRSAGDDREREKQRQVQLAAARVAKQEASRDLVSARRAAHHAQTALKKAATQAKESEEAMVAAEERLQKIASQAHEARQKARRAAVEAESAAQSVEEAERALTRATQQLTELEDE